MAKVKLEVRYLPAALLVEWEGNPRKDAGDLTELAASIGREGVLEPLIVRVLDSDPTRFQIVCGWRRKLAAVLAGLEEVPAIIRKDLDDASAWRVSLVENIQRKSLNPLEEAHAFEAAFQAGLDISDIAESIDVSPKYVNRRRALLALSAPIQKRVKSGELGLGVALEIARIKDKATQKEVSDRISPSMSARQARSVIEKTLDGYNIDTAPWRLVEGFAGKPPCEGCPFNGLTQTGQLDLPVFEGEDAKYPAQDELRAGRTCYDHACFDHKIVAWSKEHKKEALSKGKGVMTTTEWLDIAYNKRQDFIYQAEFPECEVCTQGHTYVFDDDSARFQHTGCVNMKCFRKLSRGSTPQTKTLLDESEKLARRQRKDAHNVAMRVRTAQLDFMTQALFGGGWLSKTVGLQMVAYQVARNLSAEDFVFAMTKVNSDYFAPLHIERFTELQELKRPELEQCLHAMLATQLDILDSRYVDVFAHDMGYKEKTLLLDGPALETLSKEAVFAIAGDYSIAPPASKKEAIEAILELGPAKRKGVPPSLVLLLAHMQEADQEEEAPIEDEDTDELG